MVSDLTQTNSTEKIRTHTAVDKAIGRFLRITFTGLPDGKPASLTEVEVYGKSISQ